MSAQGFYFSRPIDRERADLLVAGIPGWVGTMGAAAPNASPIG
jgi:hypothetical protein